MWFRASGPLWWPGLDLCGEAVGAASLCVWEASMYHWDLHLVLPIPPKEYLTNCNSGSFSWASSFPLLHKESLPTMVRCSHHSILKLTLYLLPIAFSSGTTQNGPLQHFFFLIRFSVLLLFSLLGSSICLSQLRFRAWPPFQTKINTSLLRLFPSSHLPLKFF